MRGDMNNYRFRQKPSFQSYGTKAQQRVMLIALVLLLAAVVVLGAFYARGAAYQVRTMEQFKRRINSNLVDAIGQVSRMTGGVQSNSSIKLGQIRQHIYSMEQINAISIAVSGEKGRLVPQEAVSALFEDLDRYELAIQTATSNTLEERTLLLTHLTALQEIIGL